MDTIIVYQCTTCMKAWEHKRSFISHGQKSGHLKSQIVKLPKKVWDELYEKHFKESEKE